MRYRNKVWIALLLLALTLLSLCCCGDEGNGGFIDEESGKIKESERIEYDPYQQSPELKEGFTDGTYNYLIYDIGYISNVPVYTDFVHIHDGLDVELEVETLKGLENMVSQTHEEIYSTSLALEARYKKSWTRSKNASIKLGDDGIGGEIGAGSQVTTAIELAVTATIEQTTSNSHTEQIRSWAEEKRRRTLRLDSTDPQGAYRFAMYDKYDVYAIVVCNRSTHDESVFYMLVPQNDISGGFEYRKNADDFGTRSSDTLSLDLNRISDREKYDSNLPQYFNLTIKENPDAVIDDNGSHGLGNVDNAVAIDISDLSPFMNGNYSIQFKVKVDVERYKLFSMVATCEAHLYNRKPHEERDSVTLEKAKSYGWLDSVDFENEYDSDVEFVFEINGADCKDTMFLCFDARGKGDDSWICESVEVEMVVIMND